MKVLLVHCDFAPASVALLNLKGFALADPELKDRVDIRILAGSVPEDPEETVARILGEAERFRPDVVGMSLYIWSRHRMYEAARRLRMLLPDAFLMWGGPDVSDQDYSHYLLDTHPAVNLIVRDEGEQTFARVLKHRLGVGQPLHEILGITFRWEGGLSFTPQVDFLEDLDRIPSLLDVPEVQARLDTMEVFALETFRGCYMGCAYCYWGGTRRRAFSMERVYSDLGRLLAHRNIKKLWFFDSMFGYKKSVAKDLLRFIVKHKAQDQTVTFYPNLDYLDEELCLLMKEAGVFIEAGVQTINENAYEYLNRKWDRKFLDSKIPLLEKYGLRANVQQLILGLPGDDISGFMRSVDYVFDLRPEAILIFPFSVLPATGYWRRREEFELDYEGEYRIVFTSKTFPEADMIRAGLIMVGAKWYERFPGLAQRVVPFLGVRPAELFEALGRAFAESHWKLQATPENKVPLRRRLLVQAFGDADSRKLGLELLEQACATLDLDANARNAVLELTRLHPYLNCEDVIDARTVAPKMARAALDAWEAHPEATAPIAASFNIFDKTVAERPESLDDPITFVAYPLEMPRDFFGRDVPRYRAIVLDEGGVTQPAAPV